MQYYCNTLAQRRFYYKNTDKALEKVRKWRSGLSDEKKEEIRAKNRLYKKNNRQKVYARNTVYRMVKSGKLKRENCSVCFFENAQAHHEDYSKPLDIIWLCSKCHGKTHRKFELEVGFGCH